MKHSLIVAAFALSGCATSNLEVVSPVKAQIRSDAAQLVYVGAPEGVPADTLAKITAKMRDAFFGGKSPAFREGPGGLTVRYGLANYKGGSTAARMLVGFGAGGAKTVLTADFVAANGDKLGEVQASSKTGLGLYGGTAATTLQKAVAEVRTYAVQNFAQPRGR